MFWISPLRRAQLDARQQKYTFQESLDKLNATFENMGFPPVGMRKYRMDQDRYDLMMIMGYERFCNCGGWE